MMPAIRNAHKHSVKQSALPDLHGGNPACCLKPDVGTAAQAEFKYREKWRNHRRHQLQVRLENVAAPKLQLTLTCSRHFLFQIYLLGFKLMSDIAPVKKSRSKSGTIFKFHNILTSRTTLFSLGSEPSHCPVYACSIPYPLVSHFWKTGMLLGAFAYVTLLLLNNGWKVPG